MTILVGWMKGVRLYIALGIALLTFHIWWWAHRVYSGTELLIPRLHEAYGWASLVCLVVAMAVGPAYKLIPRLPGAALMRDARRMIGIGAAWFAILHASVAYLGAFQAINPLQLTVLYQQGFVIGGGALLILIVLAATSFNAAMRSLGVWWFRIHRLVYPAAALAVWHAFMIGVHAPGLPALGILVATGAGLFIVHMQVALQQDKPVSNWQIATLCIMGIVVIALSNYGFQIYVEQNSLQGHGHI